MTRLVLGVVYCTVVGGIGYGIWSWNQDVKPCPTMVAHSTTCIPFGCTHTYINARGEDTGECG